MDMSAFDESVPDVDELTFITLRVENEAAGMPPSDESASDEDELASIAQRERDRGYGHASVGLMGTLCGWAHVHRTP